MEQSQDRSRQAHRGWDSDFQEFQSASKSLILKCLRDNYPDSSDSEVNSWNRTVPKLQREIGEIVEVDAGFNSFTAVLEYELPMESRRADAVLLLHDGVVVIELKGKTDSTDADVDQARAYARDLRFYHKHCHQREVYPVLVPERMPSQCKKERDVYVCSPDRLDSLVADLETRKYPDPINPEQFLSAQAYQPLPSLVRAAIELFKNRTVPQIWKSVANTDSAVTFIRNIIAEAYETNTRKLVLLTGVPGSGKTLVGLRLVHMPELESLAGGDQGVQSIFLSGNGPLVEVLQYVLKTENGSGKVFVRAIKQYVKRYSKSKSLVPSERVLVFDEAQRAHDRDQVANVHKVNLEKAQTEPDYLIEFAERIPNWSVIVGLIGSGQEINTGEEGGLGLWADAIANSPRTQDWTVYGAKETSEHFQQLSFIESPELSLNQTIRSHFASHLHEFVSKLVQKNPNSKELTAIAKEFEDRHDLWITRDLGVAKKYLADRYGSFSKARYGLIASSRDKDLEEWGIQNDFQNTKSVRVGPWYYDSEDSTGRLSCRHLEICITEFAAQGLELDAVLLAWGTDFFLKSGQWSIEKSRNYRKGTNVHNPFQLRANAYRVLLTRGRDAHVVFVPPYKILDETWEFLNACGFRQLNSTK